MSECARKLNFFCYVCGKLKFLAGLVTITPEVEKAYSEYFNQIVERNVSWAPDQ